MSTYLFVLLSVCVELFDARVCLLVCWVMRLFVRFAWFVCLLACLLGQSVVCLVCVSVRLYFWCLVDCLVCFGLRACLHICLAACLVGWCV